MEPTECVALARKAAKAGHIRDALTLLGLLEGLPSARLWLMRADLHRELCQLDAARQCLAKAAELGAYDVTRIRDTLLMSPIMESTEAIEASRRRMMASLDALLADPPVLEDPVGSLPWLDFYLAYHGGEDRALRERLAAVLRAAAPSLNFVSPHLAQRSLGEVVRVGICSSHLRDHTIGRLFGPLIQGLVDHGLQVVFLPVDEPADPMGRGFAKAATETIVLGRDLEEAQRRVAEARLDLLHYPDIGMDPFTYLLAFARLAPLQSVSWGHPITTGLDTIDAFLTTEQLTPPGTEHRFTESVVRLPDPMVAWSPPAIPRVPAPEALGLPADRPIFLVPQNAFKLHPDFDEALGGIVAACPDAVIALLAPKRDAWRAPLLRRLAGHVPDVEHSIRFVPRQNRAGYLGMLAAADVMLDPFPFGGGHTSLEGLAMGTPIVTMPTDQVRGRITASWYRVMGAHSFISHTVDDYVDQAVRWGTDPLARAAAVRRIEANRHLLFDRGDAVAAHAALIHQLASTRRRGALRAG